MRKFLTVIFLSLFLTGPAIADLPKPSATPQEVNPIVKIAGFLARALITFRFTSILNPPGEIEEEVGPGLDPAEFPNLSQVAIDEEGALRAIGDISLINPKGVFVIRSKGFFTKRFEWQIKTRFLGEVTSAQIFCSPLFGRPVPGVTLLNENEGFRGEPNWKKGEGSFVNPDRENGCGWKNYNDILRDMFLGRTFLRVKTVDNPDGALEGEIINIGIDTD